MLYEGTVVAAGSGEAVVVATGNRTEAGRTQRLDSGEAPATGVEIRLRKLTAQIPTTTRCGSGTPGLSLSPPSTCWDRFRSLR
jgi:cation-transporting ATPase I